MRKQAALRRVIRLIFLQRGGQLVRAARAVAALNAFQAADGLIHGHADDQRGDALRVARAAAVKFAGGNDVVFHLELDGAAANMLFPPVMRKNERRFYNSTRIAFFLPVTRAPFDS